MSSPNILVFSFCWNEIDILPFYLRHYETFADGIIVYDEQSTDGTREMLEAHPLVVVMEKPWKMWNGWKAKELMESTYSDAHPHADWVMWPDMDEFLYHPNMKELLAEHDKLGNNMMTTAGYSMMADEFPKDDGRQIYEICQMGINSKIYAKPIVFKPGVIGFHWDVGRHGTCDCNPKYESKPSIKLFHYRYLNPEFTRVRNARAYERSEVKAEAWSNKPTHTGDHSPKWVEEMKQHIFNVVETPPIWQRKTTEAR